MKRERGAAAAELRPPDGGSAARAVPANHPGVRRLHRRARAGGCAGPLQRNRRGEKERGGVRSAMARGGGKTSTSMWVIRGVSVVASLIAVTVVMHGMRLPSFLGGGDGAEDEDEVLPPADASATVRIRREPEDVYAFAAMPHSWPDWHVGSEMVSGQIDTLAEAGDRIREHIGVELGLGVSRELQWTMHGGKQPKYSVDGDGALHAVGHDVNDPSWRVDIRCVYTRAMLECATRSRATPVAIQMTSVPLHLGIPCFRYQLKQVRRKMMQTSFTANLYWTGAGEALSESKKEQWKEWLKESLQLLKEVLPEPSLKK